MYALLMHGDHNKQDSKFTIVKMGGNFEEDNRFWSHPCKPGAITWNIKTWEEVITMIRETINVHARQGYTNFEITIDLSCRVVMTVSIDQNNQRKSNVLLLY